MVLSMRRFVVCLKVPAFIPFARRHVHRTATRTSKDSTDPFKREVANRMIFLGEDHPRHAIAEYLKYYHRERNHQELAGRLIESGAEIGSFGGKVCRRQRLGGMLNYYYRNAA